MYVIIVVFYIESDEWGHWIMNVWMEKCNGKKKKNDETIILLFFFMFVFCLLLFVMSDGVMSVHSACQQLTEHYL